MLSKEVRSYSFFFSCDLVAIVPSVYLSKICNRTANGYQVTVKQEQVVAYFPHFYSTSTGALAWTIGKKMRDIQIEEIKEAILSLCIM